MNQSAANVPREQPPLLSPKDFSCDLYLFQLFTVIICRHSFGTLLLDLLSNSQLHCRLLSTFVAPADPARDHVRPTVVLQQSSKVWPRFQCPLWYSALAVAVPILFLLPAPVQEQIKTSLLRTPMAAAVFSAADASPHEEDQPSYLRRHKTSLWTNDGFLRCPDGVVLPNVRRSSQGSKLPLTSFHSSIAIAMQAKSSALAAAAVTVLSLF